MSSSGSSRVCHSVQSIQLSKDEISYVTLHLDEKTAIQVGLQQTISERYVRYIFAPHEGEASNLAAKKRAETVLQWAKNKLAECGLESGSHIEQQAAGWVIHVAPGKSEILLAAAMQGEKREVSLDLIDEKNEGLCTTKLHFPCGKVFDVEVQPGREMFHYRFGRTDEAKNQAEDCLDEVVKLIKTKCPDVTAARVTRHRDHLNYIFRLNLAQHTHLREMAKPIVGFRLDGQHVVGGVLPQSARPTPQSSAQPVGFFRGLAQRIENVISGKSTQKPAENKTPTKR